MWIGSLSYCTNNTNLYFFMKTYLVYWNQKKHLPRTVERITRFRIESQQSNVSVMELQRFGRAREESMQRGSLLKQMGANKCLSAQGLHTTGRRPLPSTPSHPHQHRHHNIHSCTTVVVETQNCIADVGVFFQYCFKNSR